MAYKRKGYAAISEDTINLMLKHLRRKHPEASREDVIEVLERFQEVIRYWNKSDPEGLIKLYNKLKTEKKLKTN